MLKNLTIVTVSLLGSVAASTATLPTPSYATSLNTAQVAILNKENKTQETATKEVAPEKSKEKRLVCIGCNSNESHTLEFLQNNGVTDKNAIATIMGNIRQESTFVPNICEGGSRVPYHQCHSGGFGAIQWTDSSRYNGLGQFAAKYGGDPSTLDTQLKYMLYEGDWKMIEPHMKTPGKTINEYMKFAQKWIRWGHKGPRTEYAYDYANRLVFTEVQS